MTIEDNGQGFEVEETLSSDDHEGRTLDSLAHSVLEALNEHFSLRPIVVVGTAVAGLDQLHDLYRQCVRTADIHLFRLMQIIHLQN